MNDHIQPGILEVPAAAGRYLTFRLAQPGDAELKEALRKLAAASDGRKSVIGIGLSLARRLGADIPGLRTMPAYVGRGFETPSTPAALWVWLRGEERGVLMQRSRRIEALLAPAFRLAQVLDAFKHGSGRDLTGYEDGTENPQPDEMPGIVGVTGQGEGMEGSSFAAIQQWEHDFATFESFSHEAQDNAIGRRRADNEELEDAPESAHVKRTAQESFDPEAFMLRRSLPWAEGNRGGLNFVCFCNTFHAFEAQMNRMAGGEEDGIADALFTFSRVLNGAYYWCPGMKDGKLNLSLLDI
jgi:putative iron-dependent peroxidase